MGSLSRLSKSDLARTLAHSDQVVEAEKQCRVTLHASATEPYKFNWHGGRTGLSPEMVAKPTVIVIQPGKSIVQPLGKVEATFGPFTYFEKYEECSDEAKRDYLRTYIATEVARFLNRFDYVRGNGRGFHPDMNPTGPHRAPHVIVQVINADGSEDPAIDIHELYEIGEWDELKDTFVKKETTEELVARYEQQLRDKDAANAAEIARVNEKMNEVLGVVKGFVAGREAGAAEAAEKPKAESKKEAVPA